MDGHSFEGHWKKGGVRMETPIHTNMLNGLFSDCEPFRAWLESWFHCAAVADDDKWWARDLCASAWNAGVDALCGVTLTQEQRCQRADELDRMRLGDKPCRRDPEPDYGPYTEEDGKGL